MKSNYYSFQFYLYLVLIFTSCGKLDYSYDSSLSGIPNLTIKDIDGNYYNIISPWSGSQQIWMMENLRVKSYKNGDTIPQVQSSVAWNSLTTGAWCFYDNIATGQIGVLYNWYAVNDARGLAPEGWHIPTNDEWNIFQGEIPMNGGGKIRGEGWLSSCFAYSNNETAWSALPGGVRSNGVFAGQGILSYWWSANPNPNGLNGYAFKITCANDSYFDGEEAKNNGLYIRCIKD